MKIDEVELREQLARVIDPDAWSMHDMVAKKAANPKAQEALVASSFDIADQIMVSGLMSGQSWERAEYIKARAHIVERTSRRGYCYDVSDMLDGYVMHDPKCRLWPQSAISSSSDCIKPGRN